jgi:hypothetical protein
MVRYPAFSIYAIGAKVLVGSMLYYEIKEKMRDKGRELANEKV